MVLFIGKSFSDADHSTVGGFRSLGLLKFFLDDLWGTLCQLRADWAQNVWVITFLLYSHDTRAGCTQKTWFSEPSYLIAINALKFLPSRWSPYWTAPCPKWYLAGRRQDHNSHCSVIHRHHQDETGEGREFHRLLCFSNPVPFKSLLTTSFQSHQSAHLRHMSN